MRLTPLDIRKQEFRKVMRGYDPLEVEAFLDMVADEYETLLDKRSEYLEKIKQLETRVKDFETMEQTLQSSLLEAQNAVTQSKSEGTRHSDQTLKEAKLEARRIIQNARNEAARLEREILTLKGQKASFAARLRHILESQVEVIKVLELDDVEFADLAPARRRVAAGRDDSPEPDQPPRTSKPRMGDTPVGVRQTTGEESDDENAGAADDADAGQRDEAFSVLGAGADREKDLIEKMVLEMEQEDEIPEEPDLDDNDLDAAVEKLAREKARRLQQRRKPGDDDQED